MNVSSIARARALGAILLVAVFAAGLIAGSTWDPPRGESDVVNVNVRMSSELPRELRELSLTSVQEDTLQRMLVDGQRRMREVLGDFEPRLRAVLDSVDLAIQSVLTAEQRARFEASRPKERRDRLEIDTVRR